MDYKQLKLYLESLIKLKEEIKCAVCLDAIQNSLELECCHRLCENCFDTHKSFSKNASCPLCKIPIKRRSMTYKDDYANALGQFVAEGYQMIRENYKCEVEQLHKVLKEKNTLVGAVKRSDIIQLICNQTPSTSKHTCKHSPERKNEVKVTDAFDKLMNSNNKTRRFNKQGTKFTYRNKRKVVQENYSVLNFENKENKKKVLDWLNDNQNKFDRLTQTQSVNFSQDDQTSSIFDLPSVSQKPSHNIKLSKPLLRSVRSKSAEETEEMHRPTVKVRIKSHSLGSISNFNEEILQEEKIAKEAEKKVLLDILEDECLENLENIEQQASPIAKGRLQTANEIGKSSSKNETSVGNKGWGRIKDIEKAIRKKNKKPKKLNITLEGTQVQSKPDIPKKKTDNCSFYEKHIEHDAANNRHNKMEYNAVPAKSNISAEESLSVKENRVFDLDAVEDYFSKNMPLIEQNESLNSTKISAKEVPQLSGIDDPFIMPTQKIHFREDHSNLNEKINKITEVDYISALKNVPAPFADDVYCCPTQKIVEDKSEEVEYNKVLSITPVDEFLEDQQELLTILQNNLNNIISNLCLTNDSIIKEFVNCFANISAYITKLSVLKSKQDTLKSTGRVTIGIQTSNNYLKTVSTGTDLIMSSVEVQTVTNCLDKVIQTDKTDVIEQEQSIPSVTNTQHIIKLECEKSQFNENILTGSFDNLVFDTQAIVKELEKKNENKSKSQISAKIDETVKQKQPHLSSQLIVSHKDQECTQSKTNKSKISIQTPTKIDETVNINKSNIQTAKMDQTVKNQSFNSQLIISLDEKEDTEMVTNKNHVLNESKTYKRIRVNSSNSDSDDEYMPDKKRCNRFVRNDLSIKFAETEKCATEVEANHTSESLDKSVDYDKYLENVLQNYNSQKTPDEKPSTSKENSQQNEEDKKLLELFNRCDQLIQNSTALKKPCPPIKSQETLTAKKRISSSLSGDNIFLDKKTLDKFDKELSEYEENKLKALSTEYSDIIGETENMSPVPKKRKIDDKNMQELESETNKHSETIFQKTVDEDLNTALEALGKDIQEDAFDDADEEVKSINLSAEQKIKECENKVVILQNLKLKSQEKHSDKESISDSNEDVFSDDDVVETTPQKKKESVLTQNRSILAELEALDHSLKIPSNESLPLGQSENLFIPPPPGFEDDFDSDLKDVTVVQKPVTPQASEKFTQNTPLSNKENEILNMSCTLKGFTQFNADVNASKKSIVHSTPFTPNNKIESLGVSPIAKPKSIIEVVQNSKSSPLVIKHNESFKTTPNIMTSTPRQKSILNYVKSSQEENKKQDITLKSKPVVACTRLTPEQVSRLICLSNKKLINFTSVFGSSVTHLIVSVNENGCVKDHTVKYIRAVAYGIWVLSFQWVQECLNCNAIVPEEPYEVTDLSGIPGPRTSRLTSKKEPLLRGYKFYCAPPFSSISREEVLEIIQILGGEIVPRVTDLASKDDNSVYLIITESCQTQDFEIFENWLETYKVVTVDVDWLVKSVAQYKVLSVRPTLLCSDDSICNLGYPAHLLENVPYSFSEQL